GGNPINRVYESNGPDVKVRGTAQTIADKYMQLARDAQSSGDTVMAESYNQHAEHYLRILAAAQAYNQQHMQHQQSFRRPGGEDGSDLDADPAAGESGGEESFAPRSQAADAGPQPETAEADGSFQPQPRYGQDDRPRGGGDRPRNGADPNRGQPRIEDEADGWDGPQPQFLRRGNAPQPGAGNGSDRPQRERRPMRERSPRGPETEGESQQASDKDPQTVN
ncbi:MAG TPA: DUF4167 domain-containing protein, partial [Allosphingosinicella sp.]|nr:DUF4167 domain-containing protein [Allosphingosinicella sp.]